MPLAFCLAITTIFNANLLNGNIPKKLAQVIDLALIEKPQIYLDSAEKFKEALIKI